MKDWKLNAALGVAVMIVLAAYFFGRWLGGLAK